MGEKNISKMQNEMKNKCNAKIEEVSKWVE